MKSDGIDNKKLSLERLTACLVVLLFGAAQLPGGVTQKQSDVLMKEYLDIDQHVYTALERVPVRHRKSRRNRRTFHLD